MICFFSVDLNVNHLKNLAEGHFGLIDLKHKKPVRLTNR